MTVQQWASCARTAAVELGVSVAEQRNSALTAMAEALGAHEAELLVANARDVEAARECGTNEGLIDRLMLDHGRLEGCADALLQLREFPDVLGEVIDTRTISGGVEMEQVRVPLGVVGMIYEARPNVTVDSAGIAIKTGNAILLRGGSLARHSNDALIAVLREAIAGVGLSPDCICPIDATSRDTSAALMEARGLIDVLIPRGGAGLISAVVEHSKVPVIETGTGNCHIYIEQTAEAEMATSIVVNAKCQRPSVCNAAESLVIDRAATERVLPQIVRALHERGVTIVADDASYPVAAQTLGEAALADSTGGSVAIGLEHATEDDFGTEYLDLMISVKVVEDYREAVEHINRYGTHHSEAIVTSDAAAADYFLARVDAAAVYVNASTRFTDGGEFGLGAEIGISTQKLHARGPMGLRALTSSKYLLRGTGQVRG
ncbi:MAG: glutamate-5-semialdehyde dehydrogenase [Coriobacteriia bacterium]|nr:glutamate-5-semialdehyde dehydrogenase [Coriobacteriia bacterium]